MFTRTVGCRARMRPVLVALALGMAVQGACAADADAYPSRPLTIVVPSVAGNVNDAVARLIGQELTRAWGQPVIVDNRPGAGAATGTKYAAHAPKDGYTALLTFTAHVQNPTLYPKIGYDPLADFVPVSEVATSATALAVTADLPVRTLPELVALVKANPGKYPYGSYGVGTSGHIYGERFKRDAGLEMDHIAYRGGVPLTTDLVAGHVRIGMVPVGTAIGMLQNGKLVPLALTGSQRSSQLPNVPTFRELGFKGFEPDTWMGLLFPAGVPKARVDALSQQVARIVRLPEIARRMRELNLEPIGSTPAQFGAVLKSDYETWNAMIRALNIRGE